MAKTPLFAALQRAFARARGHADTPLSGEGRARRRAILQAAASSMAAAAVPSLAGCGDDTEPPPGEEETIVIVGGGIAGLHCAYRLKEAGISATIYEAQERVGGRMYSAVGEFPEAPEQLCELGGELIDSGHATLFALSDELGIALDDRKAEPYGSLQQDTYYVNGATVSEATITAQFAAVAPQMAADLEAAESDDAAYATLDATSLDQYLQDVVPVATYPELHAVLQAAYRGEYGLENDQQSCLNLIYLIGSDEPDPFRIFGVSDERYHTHTGNETFPRLIAESLDPEQIQLGHSLLAVRNVESGYELDFETASGTVVVAATRIVFALPFTKLREVDLTGLTLSEEKRDIIDNLGYGTNAKVMAGFSTRVWRETHGANGSLVTDLGAQQTWETTIGQEGDHGIITNYLGGAQGLASGDGTAGSWIASVLPDVELVWPGTSFAYTGTAVRMHWPTVPTVKGSYACYTPGQWAFFGLEGAREGNLHFCGEHCSQDYQGYMEGGAETGALVAAEIIDDQGSAQPQGMLKALGVKLLFPQACYRAGRFGKLNPFQRRRLQREVLRRIYASAAE